jgi:putative nucleotidyltransferase with HDIG domain
MDTLAPWAGLLARALLQESFPRRWAHVQGVADRASSLAPVLGADADLLEAAAWLHDIGYAPDLAMTGLHALDGARYLRDTQHADAMLCRLVAHHSCAIIEAEERGLADVLSLEFEPAPQMLSSVLTYCDMTTSPDGELVSAKQRLAEIQRR